MSLPVLLDGESYVQKRRMRKKKGLVPIYIPFAIVFGHVNGEAENNSEGNISILCLFFDDFVCSVSLETVWDR